MTAKSNLSFRSGLLVATCATVAVAAIIAAMLLGAAESPNSPSTYVESSAKRQKFYRLQSSYLHGDEKIGFDIVVGCDVRISHYQGGDNSFDAFRYPNFFVKATKDGGAILQKIPLACSGETTENGKVPADFLPGAIWFPDKNDLTFGEGYFFEDAFLRPDAPLKFLGASIHSASKAEWDAFQETLAGNLIEPLPYTNFGLQTHPTKAEVLGALKDKSKARTWQNILQCDGVARYRLTDTGSREILRKLWPEDKPRFWANAALVAPWDSLRTSDGLLVDGHSFADVANTDDVVRGFPTNARGGIIGSGKDKGKWPPDVYPMRSSAGLHWVEPNQPTEPIYNDVELQSGKGPGLLYCYSWSEISIAFPDIWSNGVITRIDGQPIRDEAKLGGDPSGRPSVFFENDEYFYRRFTVHLN